MSGCSLTRTGTFHGFAVRARYALFVMAMNLCARRRSLHCARDKRSIVPASYASVVPATVGSYQPDKLNFCSYEKNGSCSARSLRDLIAAAAQLFVKYCVIGVGYPPGLSDPYALSFAKISSVAVRSSFSPAIFCSNKLPGIG